MILSMLRLQLNTETDFRTWHFQGVGMQGSHYALRSVVLYSEPKQDLAYFSEACDFIFNHAEPKLANFTFVEAHLRAEQGEMWRLSRSAAGYTILKNNVSTSLQDFQDAILASVTHPSANKKNHKIVGAWQVSKGFLVEDETFEDDFQEGSLAETFRKKEHDLIMQLQTLIGRSFVVNRGNLLDLYDQIDQYLARKQILSKQIGEIDDKVKEVGRYGVRRLELIKNECVLLQRIQEQLELIDAEPENNMSIQVLEKIIFFWNRQHGTTNFVRTAPALISFARKLLSENSAKIDTLERINQYRADFKQTVRDREAFFEGIRALDFQLKKYFSHQRIDLSFFNQASWQQFYQLMDSWLLMDGLADSTCTSSGRRQDLFMHQQMESPVAIYLLPSDKTLVDTEKFVSKLRTANQTIFRIFLTDDVQFHNALVKAGMGWAQTI